MWGDEMKKHFIQNIFAVIKIRHFTVIVCLLFTVIYSFSVFYILSSSIISTAGSANSLPSVIVDAGHGGEDGGAVAADGTNEKDYNLDIALRLDQILKMNGYNVIMTRTDDIMTCDDGLPTLRARKISDIHNRFRIITENPNALFVSIHQNKYSDPLQHGTQVFYSGNNELSKALAESIQSAVVSKFQQDNKRAVKKSGSEIYLLYNARSPAILVECGFISNYDDLNKLKTDEYKTQMSMMIAEGIINFDRKGD